MNTPPPRRSLGRPIIKLSAPATREYWEIPVLYEDDDLLALDKPARLLTAPDRYDPQRPNLMKLLHHDIARGAAWVKSRNLTYLSNAHRLDMETSGILLLAKNKVMLTALVNLFGSLKPLKSYVALVRGQPRDQNFHVEAQIAPHPFRPGRMRVDLKHGKMAKTIFQVREAYRGYALIACQPLTGRTHQIRVHLKSVGLPVVGDAGYGGSPLLLSQLKKAYRPKKNAAEKPLIGRVALHAEQLALVHPVTGAPIEIQSPWPNDFRVAVKYLRQFAGHPPLAIH